MKKLLLLSTLLVFGLFSTTVGQDLQGMFSLSAFGGVGIPMGDLADDDPEAMEEGDAAYRAMGFKFGVAGEYFFTPQLAIGMDFRYVSFGSKDIEFQGETFETDDKLNVMMIGVHGKFVFMTEGDMRPYAIAGAGLAFPKLKDIVGFDETDEKVDIDIDSKPYFIFGGGVIFFVTPTVSLFGEATFDYMLTDGAMMEYDGTEIGEIETNYYSIDLAVGVAFWFGGTE